MSNVPPPKSYTAILQNTATPDQINNSTCTHELACFSPSPHILSSPLSSPNDSAAAVGSLITLNTFSPAICPASFVACTKTPSIDYTIVHPIYEQLHSSFTDGHHDGHDVIISDVIVSVMSLSVMSLLVMSLLRFVTMIFNGVLTMSTTDIPVFVSH